MRLFGGGESQANKINTVLFLFVLCVLVATKTLFKTNENNYLMALFFSLISTRPCTMVHCTLYSQQNDIGAPKLRITFSCQFFPLLIDNRFLLFRSVTIYFWPLLIRTITIERGKNRKKAINQLR